MEKKWFVVLLILLCFWAVHASAQQTETVMIYLCGSNLESQYGSASADIEEMLFSDFDSGQINVLLMTGGSRFWRTEQDADSLQISRIRRGQLKLEETLPARSMGDPETLSGFLVWGKEHYPAQRYSLIIWDHGAGPLGGICFDELNSPDHLSLSDLRLALDTAFPSEKLAWIGFDACLMSSVEVADTLAPYAEYLIASQAEEPASGWNYSFLRGLENDSDGAAAGRRIIDAYFDAAPELSPDLTLSCIRLSALEAVEESMNQMFRPIASGLSASSFSRISNLRFRSTGFGKSVDTSLAAGGYDLTDILSLCECFEAEAPAEARRVREAVEQAVVYHRENLSDCCGLSVYHPFRNQYGYAQAWAKSYRSLDFCPGYIDYVDAYGRIMTGDALVGWSNLAGAETSEDGSLISLNLSEDQAGNLASARLVILARNLYDTMDDAWFRVYTSSSVRVDGTRLSSSYSGQALQAIDQSGYSALTGALSFEMTEDGLILLSLYPCGEDGTVADRPVIAEYTLDESDHLQLKDYAVFDELTGAWTRRADVDWSAFSGLVFRNQYRNLPAESGEGFPAFDAWPEDSHERVQLVAQQQIETTRFFPSFALDLTSGEDLYAAFEITDTQGTVHTSPPVPLGRHQVFREHYDNSSFIFDRVLSGLDVSVRTNWEERRIDLSMEVYNTSWADPVYRLDDLMLNGLSVSPEITCRSAEGDPVPGAESQPLDGGGHALFVISFSPETLDGLDPGDTLTTFSGSLRIRDKWDKEYSIPFFLDFSLPVSVITHEEGEPVQEDISAPLSPDFFWPASLSADLILRQGENAGDGTVIFSISVRNEGSVDMEYSMDQVRINHWSLFSGYTVDNWDVGSFVRTESSGRIRPGESGTASCTFRYDADSKNALLFPDASIWEVSFALSTWYGGEELTSLFDCIPLSLSSDLSLNPVHSDTEVLPSQQLIDELYWASRFVEKASVPIFSSEECTLSLQHVFFCGDKPVLLLRAANHSEKKVTVSLGDAMIDGLKADIGQTVHSDTFVHNNQTRVFSLDRDLWPEEHFALLELSPNAEQFHFVSVLPSGDPPAEISQFSFRALITPDDPDNADTTTLYSAAEIRLPAPVALSGEQEQSVSAADCQITRGEPAPRTSCMDLLSDEVLLSDLSEDHSVPLVLSLPEDEAVTQAGYYLVRRIRSVSELAAQNIRLIDLSFTEHAEWLLWEANGVLTLSPDKKSAVGSFPGVLPMLCCSDGHFTLPITSVIREGADAVVFRVFLSNLIFRSSGYDENAFGGTLGELELKWRSAEKTTEFTWQPQKEMAYPSLSDCVVVAWLFAFPGDIELSEDYSDFVDNQLAGTLQIHRMESRPLRIALEPLRDLENYEVLFWYTLDNGKTRYTQPVPLSDLMQVSE